MIVFQSGALLRIVTQTDHARLAAEILALWREDGLPRHPRRDDLLFAAREHDNGWREVDAAPRVDPAEGRPYTFLDLPAELRTELWSRGVERHRGDRPYVAALILEHAIRLHEDRRQQPGWRGWLRSLAELREELIEEHGIEPGLLALDYPWLRLGDRISLALCRGGEERFVEGGRTFETTPGGVLRIDPLPLAGATSFDLPVRRIPARRYAGDADLGGELAAARWQSLRVRVSGRPDTP